MEDNWNLIVLVFAYLIPGTLLWLRMQKILSSKSAESDSDFISPFDLIKFWRIIHSESDKKIKTRYLLVFWTQIILLISFFAAFFILKM